MVQRGKSYAQALRGEGIAHTASININASEEGNGWIYESVIVRLKPPNCVATFKEELNNRGMGDIQV